MTSICTNTRAPDASPLKQADTRRGAAENRRFVIAAVLGLLLVAAEAVVFFHMVKTHPEITSTYVDVP